VIGKGNIGGTLGSKWRAAGHDVVYGARDGSGQGPGGAPVRSVGDALEDAEVVLLAVPGQAVPDVVNEQGAALAGKVVIDAVNRMGAPEFDSRALIGAAAPSARYVRAFNSLGWENFADPLPGTNLFFAADPEARASAEELISAVGLEPVFVGASRPGARAVTRGTISSSRRSIWASRNRARRPSSERTVNEVWALAGRHR